MPVVPRCCLKKGGAGFRKAVTFGGYLTRLDVVAYDADVVVSVRPRVLMPESYHVPELMHHDSKLVAVLADGNGLGSASPAAHVGATPSGKSYSVTLVQDKSLAFHHLQQSRLVPNNCGYL